MKNHMTRAKRDREKLRLEKRARKKRSKPISGTVHLIGA
jgi:hypothetical protein